MTKEDKLQAIQDLFKVEGQGKPQVHELISAHTAIRGAKQVIIKKVASKETNKKDEITVTIELLQYDTMKITAATASGKGKKKGTSSDNTSNLSEDYKKYLNGGRGLAPKRQNKTAMSPAQTERWKQQYDRG